MKREKLISLISLLVLSVLITGFTWGYWFDGTLLPPKDVTTTHTMTVGSGEAVTVSTQIGDMRIFKNSNLPLVPEGKAITGKSVDSLDTFYTVEWQEEGTELAQGHPGTLDVTYSNFRFEKI